MKYNNEIIKLISATWVNFGEKELEKSFISRFWSIDTQWMEYNKAEKLIMELIKNEWLIEKKDNVIPNIIIDQECISMGWKPNEIVFENITKNKFNKNTIQEITIKDEVVIINKETNNTFTSKERRLIRYISANTGIKKEEIKRRCERKRRSLNQATITICLLLIAKEQDMDIDELVQGIIN